MFTALLSPFLFQLFNEFVCELTSLQWHTPSRVIPAISSTWPCLNIYFFKLPPKQVLFRRFSFLKVRLKLREKYFPHSFKRMISFLFQSKKYCVARRTFWQKKPGDFLFGLCKKGYTCISLFILYFSHHNISGWFRYLATPINSGNVDEASYRAPTFEQHFCSQGDPASSWEHPCCPIHFHFTIFLKCAGFIYKTGFIAA